MYFLYFFCPFFPFFSIFFYFFFVFLIFLMFESEFYCNCSLLVTFYLYMLTLSCLITLLHPKSDLLCSACGVSLWEGSRLPGWANCGPTVPAITGFAVSACGDILIGQLQNLGRTLCRGLGHRMPPPPFGCWQCRRWPWGRLAGGYWKSGSGGKAHIWIAWQTFKRLELCIHAAGDLAVCCSLVPRNLGSHMELRLVQISTVDLSCGLSCV